MLTPHRPLWRVSLPGPVLGCPTPAQLAGGERLVVVPWTRLDRQFAPLAGGIVTLDATSGVERWRWPAGGEGPVQADRPLVSGDTLLTAGQDGLLRCLALADGQLHWQARLEELPFSPVLDLRAACVCVATLPGHLFLVEGSNGQGTRLPFEADAALSTAPTVAGNLLVCADEEGAVYAVDLTTGRERWRFHGQTGRGERVAGLATAAKTVLVTTDAGYLYALDHRTGKHRWTPWHVEETISARPVVAGRTAYVAAHDGRLYAVDVGTGRTRWSFATGKRISGAPAPLDGLVFTGSQDGHVYAVTGADGQKVWRCPAGGRVMGDVSTADGRVFAGTMLLDEARRPAGGEVVAFPWHLGLWAWAADWCAERQSPLAAGDFYALEGSPEKAERCWAGAGRPDLAARLWEAVGEDAHAARGYETAATALKFRDPARAAQFYRLAAERYVLAEQDREAARCSRLAARLGRFPHLRLEAFNVPHFRQYEAGKFTLRIKNVGEGEARNVSLALGGTLAEPVTATIKEPLPPQERWDITLQVTPTAGQSTLNVEAEYVDKAERRRPFHVAVQVPIEAEARSAPLVQVGGDVGMVRVAIAGAEGSAGRPTVQVGGDAGVVKVSGIAT